MKGGLERVREMYNFKKVLHHLLVCRTAVVFALKNGDQGIVEEGNIRADLAIRRFNNVDDSTCVCIHQQDWKI